jgi:hypothetical protein
MNLARHEVQLALGSTGVAVVIYGLLAAVGLHLGLQLLPEAESAAPQVVRARLAGDEPRRPSRPLSERSFGPSGGSRVTRFGSRRGPLLERVHAPRLPAAPGRSRNGRRSPAPQTTPPTTTPSGDPSVRPPPGTGLELPSVPQLPTPPPPPAVPQLASLPPAPPTPPAPPPNLGVPTVPLPELPGAPTVPNPPELP